MKPLLTLFIALVTVCSSGFFASPVTGLEVGDILTESESGTVICGEIPGICDIVWDVEHGAYQVTTAKVLRYQYKFDGSMASLNKRLPPLG